MTKKKIDFELPELDELFSTGELKSVEEVVRLVNVPLEMIDDFPDHPFNVRDDDEMLQLVDSISVRGVITPALVRVNESGRYEMISGHRRKRACEILGIPTIKCEVSTMSRDEAIIIMVDSNIQRDNVLPSEKAFAYKMKLEAMKRQGERNDLTSDPLGPKLKNMRSNETLAQETKDSVTQIKRYIRLTYLVPELLQLVDEGRIKMRPAVELSYLDEECQRDIVEEIDLNECTPSHDQAIRMRKMFNDGKLTTEAISAIMSEEKPNQREKLVFRGDRVRSLIPKNITLAQTEDYVCKALEFYSKHLRQRAEKNAR